MDSQKDWLNFVKFCHSVEHFNDFEALLTLFLTPQEKESLVMRFLIVRSLLKNEETQRDIAKKLNVSIAKITRGSNELKRLSPSHLKFLKSKMTTLKP